MRKPPRPYLVSWCLGCLALIWSCWTWTHATERAERHEIRSYGCWGEPGVDDVVVARHPLPAGARVSIDDLMAVKRPTQFLDRGSVKVDEHEYIERQRLVRHIEAGDVFTWSHFMASAAR